MISSLRRLVPMSQSLFIAAVLFQVLISHCSNAFAKSNSIKQRNGNSKQQSIEKGAFRDSRFFFINFNQDLCTTDSGESGVCMKTSACTRQGGTSGGTCAQGFGTCCLLTKACTGEPQTITVNGTRLVQPVSGIGTTVDSCRYSIPKQAGVCQIRLDFTNFMIDEGPEAEFFGNCVADTLDISGQTNGKLGHLCGNLAGQHMYLDYGQNLNIDINIGLASSANQMWDILVTMIKCDSPNKAPPGCLQYFTTQRGKVQSFNFNVNKHQLNDQDYSVCVKNNPGMTKITWKTCTNDIYDFDISGGLPAVCPPNPPPGCEPIGNIINGTDCTNDWVMIYGDNKYCGSYFPDSVVSTTQPFMMQVHFDAQEVYLPGPDPPPGFENDDTNTGFCLQYFQSSF